MLAWEWDKDLALQAHFDDGFDTGDEKGVESVALNLLIAVSENNVIEYGSYSLI